MSRQGKILRIWEIEVGSAGCNGYEVETSGYSWDFLSTWSLSCSLVGVLDLCIPTLYGELVEDSDRASTAVR